MEEKQIFMDLTTIMGAEDQDQVRDLIQVHADPYSAAKDAHAVVICTEWDEFTVRLHMYSTYNSKLIPCIMFTKIILDSGLPKDL